MLLLNVLTTVRGGLEEGSALTHGHIPSLTIINTPDVPVNERQRTKGINAAEPAERVTTMTSWVSWKPGMKRLWTTPAQTHTHTQRALGQLKPPWEYGSVEEGIGIGPQELKESGCVWNFGSCFSPHIPHYSPNNKLCHSLYNSLHSGYLSPQKASDHTKPHTNLLNSGDNILKRVVEL